MREIQLPKVNWNGTSRADLFNGYLSVIAAIEAAMNALCHIAPHGRDYQTLADPDDAYARANQEHRERMLSLHHLSVELHALAESVQP